MLLDLETEPASGELLEEKADGVAIEARELRLQGRGLSLRIEPGERIGLVGMPHRARTELLGILYGTHRPAGGNVLLDGIPATSMAPRARRHPIQLVSGAVSVCGGTLEDNLTSQESRASAGELRDLLAELPDGLETWIHPDGEPLGRSQLDALDVARALLRRPRLVLVDHALDAVGGDALSPLLEALTRRDAHWTLVVASERPEVLERCDRIYRWCDHGLEELPT